MPEAWSALTSPVRAALPSAAASAAEMAMPLPPAGVVHTEPSLPIMAALSQSLGAWPMMVSM